MLGPLEAVGFFDAVGTLYVLMGTLDVLLGILALLRTRDFLQDVLGVLLLGDLDVLLRDLNVLLSVHGTLLGILGVRRTRVVLVHALDFLQGLGGLLSTLDALRALGVHGARRPAHHPKFRATAESVG